MTQRILHINVHPSKQYLLASDYNGVVYKMTKDLEIIAQSDPYPGRIHPLYIIVSNDDYIYGRDMQGNLIQWRFSDLSLKNIIYLRNFCDEKTRQESTPVPTMSHGLFLWKDQVLVVGPYGTTLQFNAEDLSYLQELPTNMNAFPESLCTDLEDNHVLSDCTGFVWYGHIERSFEQRLRLDYGPVHCIRYDSKHNRHWMTTDNHRGFCIVGVNGESIHRVRITDDDCEWLELSADCETAYVACFDHHLYIFDNSGDIPQLKQKVGPFKFQLKQVAHIDKDHTYVGLESGEIFCIDQHGQVSAEAPFGSNCIWDIVKDPINNNTVFCPLEDGGVCQVKYGVSELGAYDLQVTNRLPSFGFGRVRRLKPLQDGSFIAGCTNGTVFKAGRSGDIIWQYLSSSIVRDIALSPDETHCIAVNEAGEVLQLSTKDGELVWIDTFDRPLWAACYYDEDILISERCMSEEDQGVESTVPYANLYQIDAQTKEIKLAIEVVGNIKRIKQLDNGNILINGNGDVSAIEYNLEQRKGLHSWSAFQLNTCEDAIQFNDHVHTVTYGYQLNSYQKDGTLVDSQFSPDNYPKALYCDELSYADDQDSVPILLVAGRGPYVSMYHVRDGIPDVARTVYVN